MQPDMPFSMNTPEEIKSVTDLIQTLLKAKKTVRMYPDNNPVYLKTIDEVRARFNEFFCYRDELTLKIKQNEIFFDAGQVYQNPEKNDNLALFFFKDGLREITFKKGLAAEEVEGFLKIISLDFDREALDDDIVTLLWEQDFQHIKYLADDTLLFEDDNYETEAVAKAKENSAGSDDLLRAYTEAINAEEFKGLEIAKLTDKDLQMLLTEIRSDSINKVGKLSHILFEIILQAENAAEIEAVYNFIKDTMLYALKNKDLNTALEIVKRAIAMAKEDGSDSNRSFMRSMLLCVNSDDAMKYFCDILGSGTGMDEKVLMEYAGFLDKDAIGPLVSVLGELKDHSITMAVINILTALGTKDMADLAGGLRDSRWHVIRNTIQVLRHIGDKRAVEYLVNTAKHTEAKVRAEALQALGETKSPNALQVLRDSLDDPDRSVRIAAAKALGSYRSETAKRLVLAKAAEKDFNDREFDEKKAFYEVLSDWRDRDVAEFMTGMLGRSAFFKKSLHDESRACAAYALGLMGWKDAAGMLDKLKDSKNDLLNEYVNDAIKRIRNAG